MLLMSTNSVSYTLSLRKPHKKKSGHVKFGDLEDQGIGPSVPIHFTSNVSFKNGFTILVL